MFKYYLIHPTFVIDELIKIVILKYTTLFTIETTGLDSHNNTCPLSKHALLMLPIHDLQLMFVLLNET